MKATLLQIALCIGISCAFGQANFQKGIEYFQQNNPDKANPIFSSITKDQNEYAEAQYYLGRIFFDQNEYEEAAEYFENALEHDGSNADYHYWLGATYGTIAGDANILRKGYLATKIKSELEEAIRLDPKHLDAHRGLIQFYTEAPGIMGGSWQKAEETAKKMIKLNSAAGHLELARVYEQQEKFDLAEKEYLIAYKEEPNVNLVYSIGYFYQQQNKFEKSISFYETFLQENPDNMGIKYQYGRACAISGSHLKKGEEYLKEYLKYSPQKNEPSHAGALMRLGLIHEKSGDKMKARKYYEDALNEDSSLKEAKEGLVRVKK